MNGTRVAADKTIDSYKFDMDGLATTWHRKFLFKINASPESKYQWRPIPREQEIRSETALPRIPLNYRQQGEVGRKEVKKLLLLLTTLLVYSVVTSLAFIMITVLYATGSSIKNVRTVGKVQEITQFQFPVIFCKFIQLLHPQLSKPQPNLNLTST